MDIETRRLLLTETYRVVSDHVNWLNDKELMKFSNQQFIDHDYDTQYQFLCNANINGTPLVYDIRIKEEPAPGGGIVTMSGVTGVGPSVGSLHIHVDARHSRADLGIMIGPEHQKHGYGFEAWKGATDFCFFKLGLLKLEAGCVPENTPMLNILLRQGWEPEGERRSHFAYGGKRYSVVHYGRVA